MSWPGLWRSWLCRGHAPAPAPSVHAVGALGALGEAARASASSCAHTPPSR